MAATVVERLDPVQLGLTGEADTAGKLSAFIDRLIARLGPDAVLRFQPHGSHIPEFGSRWVAAAGSPNTTESWPDRDPDDPPMRPLHLFSPPQPIETMEISAERKLSRKDSVVVRIAPRRRRFWITSWRP